jgi:hypothetical protein
LFLPCYSLVEAPCVAVNPELNNSAMYSSFVCLLLPCVEELAMREISLSEVRGNIAAASKPQKVEIARFKDENSTVPRVVTASQSYIVYSLKSRSALRVLPRQASKQGTQLAYKRHTSNVTTAQFVNMRSNIIASASESELLVWYVDEESQTLCTYFALNRNVVSFSWMPVANQPPDLLVLIKDGDKHHAAMLKASALIVQSTKTADGVVGKPDGSLVADDASLVVLRRDIDVAIPFTSAASPIFSFSAGNDSIVTASLGNTSAPAWKACEGEAVQAVSVMPNELLVAVGASALFVWDVAGEPTLLQRILLGARRCMALQCTASRATAFVSVGNENTSEAVSFMMQPKVGAVAASAYEVDCLVTPVSSCVVPGASDEPRLHVDAGNVLQVLLLQDAAWTPLDPSAAIPAAPANITSPKHPKQNSPPPAASPNPTQAAASQISQPRSVPLVNAGAAFGAASNPELEAVKAHIEAALANTASMLNVSQNVIYKDHSNLIQEALKAQAKTLAALASQQNPRSSAAGSGAAATGSNVFDSVLDGITEPVALALVEGISNAVEEQLRTQLETALRVVLTKQEKRKQKDQMADLRTNIDTIVGDVMTTVQQTVQEKQVAYASRLIHYVSDVAGEGGAAVNQLQQIIVAQQQQLQAITQSGLLEELKRLREEVAQLKSRQAAPTAAPENVPKETVLANAQMHLAQGNHMTGLNWVMQYDDPALVTQVLINCNEETRNAMLEDESIPEAVWGRLLGCLASNPKKETLEPSLLWLVDIALEKQGLLRNDQLVVAVGNFVNSWKSASGLSSTAKDKLRQLVLLIRRQ